MEIRELLDKKVAWLTAKEGGSDIVMSSRIRLARNLEGVPFKFFADESQELELEKKLKDVFDKNIFLKKASYFDLTKLSETECTFLVERHLINPQLVSITYP